LKRQQFRDGQTIYEMASSWESGEGKKGEISPHTTRGEAEGSHTFEMTGRGAAGKRDSRAIGMRIDLIPLQMVMM